MEALLTKRLTYSDYVQLTPPDSGQYQLIQGELVTMTSPNTRHQRIIRLLTKSLETYLEKSPLGEIFLSPMDVVMGEGYVLHNNKFQHKIQIEKKGKIPSEIFPGLDLDLEAILP